MSAVLSGLRRHALIVTVLFFAAALYFAWSWNDALGMPFADGPNYLMMAQHYSWYGRPDPIYAEVASDVRFPPLYPMLLAAFDAGDNLLRAHALTTSCILLALLAFHAWLRREGISAGQSALLVLGFAAVPGSWFAALSVQSEYLYLLFSLAALALMAGYRLERRSELLYAAALAVSAAMLTRTVGISLLPALAILLWRAPMRTALIASVLALLPLLAWHFAHQSTQNGYADALNIVFGGKGWTGLQQQLAVELPALRRGFGDNFQPGTGLRPLAELLGAASLAVVTWRAAKLRPDGIYVVMHLAILLVWPFPEESARFVWVLLPVLLAQPLLALAEFRREPAATGRLALIPPAWAGAVLLLSLPGIGMAAGRYRDAAYIELPEARAYVVWYVPEFATAKQLAEVQVIVVKAMQAIAEQVPVSDCVIGIRPDLINYYGRRYSVPPPLNSVPDPRFTADLQHSGCRYIFVSATKDKNYPNFYHPLQRLGLQVDALYQSTLPDTPGLIAALVRNPALAESAK